MNWLEMKFWIIIICIANIYGFEVNNIAGIWQIPEEIEGQISIGEIFIKDDKAYAYAFEYAINDNGKLKYRDISKENSDASKLRNKIFLVNLKWNGKEWINGRIYRPSTGGVYAVSAKLVDENTLSLRISYDRWGFLGKTLIWNRLNKESYKTPNIKSIKIIDALREY